VTDQLPSEKPSSLPGSQPAATNPIFRYLSRFDDGEVLRWAFRGLLIGTIGVLVTDLSDMSKINGWFATPPGNTAPTDPILPPAVDTGTPAPAGDPRPFLTTDEAALKQPMAFTLEPGGVLKAEGSIEPGSAARLAEELTQRGEYVRTVSLNSPGGAVEDAMAMARTLRERKIGTEVADGALCASSCPLVFAGGLTRKAGEKAAIGVHQFYAAMKDDLSRDQVMSDAQATTARISRHLADMGVDPALWLHALDTPPRALYYLSAKELVDYKLVTTTKLTAKK
jgi:hypothetical protein